MRPSGRFLGYGLGVPQNSPCRNLPAVAWPAGNPDGPSLFKASHAFALREGYQRVLAHFVLVCRNYAWGDFRVTLVPYAVRHGRAHEEVELRLPPLVGASLVDKEPLSHLSS